MADSRPSTANEKFEATAAAPHKHKGFFSRKKPSTAPDDNINEKGGNITTEVKPTVPEVPPISFLQLFRSVKFLSCFLDSILTYSLIRYSTKFELCIDALGLLAAVGAGAAQVRTDFLGPRDGFYTLFYSL